MAGATSAKRTALLVASLAAIEALRINSGRANDREVLNLAYLDALRTGYRGDDDPEELKEAIEKDSQIWKRHWWPLEPPVHHPGLLNPTESWLEEGQAVQARYNEYWRSLPRLKASARLDEAQRAPYLKDRGWHTAARLEIDENDTEPAELCIVNHHKAGVTVYSHIREALPPEVFRNATEHWEPIMDGTHYVGRNEKFLHFIRDPVDLIVSGYRYHQHKWGREVWSWGHLRLQDPPCFECDDEDHDIIFSSCDSNCTYFELLNRLDEVSGVATEAISARLALTSMAEFMSMMVGNRNALQLSFGLFQADPVKTSACLLKFLGFKGNATLTKSVASAAVTVQDPAHVTHGLYDNSKVKAYLEGHPAWAQDFRAIRKLMRRVFRRQAKLYGCPEEEAR